MRNVGKTRNAMNVARKASLWIRRYFLSSPDVHVSSREHFEKLLERWMRDPCEKSKDRDYLVDRRAQLRTEG